jgi:hypothetical protein
LARARAADMSIASPPAARQAGQALNFRCITGI